MDDIPVDYKGRKPLIRKIEALRKGRTLLCFMNFDRLTDFPVPGITTQFTADVKEALFRVLKESKPKGGIDLFLYTRGGDTNSVWPFVSIIREFDPDFCVLVPFRCHSSGTLVALGAKRIIMGPLSELSPIDPSTGNQFNPSDAGQKLAISVEDVRSYQTFVREQFRETTKRDGASKELPFDTFAAKHLQPFVARLTELVHPLALGNVQRVLSQIKRLAENLLKLHVVKNEDHDHVIDSLTTHFYSHLHMINRHEASEILGARVEFATADLAASMDRLLRAYEEQMNLRRCFVLSEFLKDEFEKPARFLGAVLESTSRSYVYETTGVLRQRSRIPQNVQLNLPAGQPMPLIPGLPRDFEFQLTGQGWVNNPSPKGFTK